MNLEEEYAVVLTGKKPGDNALTPKGDAPP
jgi:hypothetical protein